MEESRYRVIPAWFRMLEGAFGGFTSFLGPERHHAAGGFVASAAGVDGALGAAGAQPVREVEHLWMHPT